MSFRATKTLSSRATKTFVIPSEVEESYAEPQDPPTTLRYIQDDRLFFLVTRHSKLDTKFLVIPKACPMTVESALGAEVEQSFSWPLKKLQDNIK